MENNKFYNLIHYRFVSLKYFNEYRYNEEYYLQFINEDRIE